MAGTKKPNDFAPGKGLDDVKAHVDFSADRLEACNERRKSNAALRQIKLIRKSMDNLTSDQSDLTEVEFMLKKAMEDVDEDIKLVTKMRDCALKAVLFQHGLLPPEEAEPSVPVVVPGQGGAAGSAGATGEKSTTKAQ